MSSLYSIHYARWRRWSLVSSLRGSNNIKCSYATACVKITVLVANGMYLDVTRLELARDERRKETFEVSLCCCDC